MSRDRPTNIISKTGQLFELYRGNYEVVANSPTLIYGSSLDGRVSVTQDGQIYQIDRNELIELQGSKIVACVVAQHLGNKIMRALPTQVVNRFIVLTTDNEVHAIHITLAGVLSSRLIRTGVTALMGMTEQSACAILHGNRWELISFKNDKYSVTRATGSPPSNRNFQIMGGVCIDDEGIHYIDTRGTPTFRLIEGVAKSACYYDAKNLTEVVGLDESGEVFLARNAKITRDFDHINYSDGKVVELVFLEGRCYAVDEHDNVRRMGYYEEDNDDTIQLIPVEIPAELLS